MSTPAADAWRDPSAQQDTASTLATAFGLWGGPVAWFIQVCAGYTLSSWPCYPLDTPRLGPPSGYGWTWGAVIGISIAAFVVALLSLQVSRAAYRRSATIGIPPRSPVELRMQRACFLALWGVVFSAGSAVVIAFTTIALSLLPRCAV